MNRSLSVDHFDLSPEAVRARREWAVRQGNPQWLWPETSVRAWREVLSRIEEAIRFVLAGDRIAVLEGDPHDIGIAGFTSGMGPLLAYWLREGVLEAPPAVAAVLELHFWHNCRRMEVLSRHAIMTVETLADAGVDVTVLKGMHTAYAYFPAPGTRPLSDIDLLIEAREEPAAAEILRSLDYVPQPPFFGEQSWRKANAPDEPRSLSLVHCDGPWCIDLHTCLSRRYAPGASMVELDEALRERVLCPWPLSSKGKVLPPNELVLYLACHASMPFLSLTLLRLTELIFVIRQLEAEQVLSWDRFLSLAERTGNAGNAYPALHFANAIAPSTISPAVLRAMKEQAPSAVRQVLERLTPAECHRVVACSLKERFMWTRTFRGWMREIRNVLLPPLGVRQLLECYKIRFWRIAQRTLTG